MKLMSFIRSRFEPIGPGLRSHQPGDRIGLDFGRPLATRLMAFGFGSSDLVLRICSRDAIPQHTPGRRPRPAAGDGLCLLGAGLRLHLHAGATVLLEPASILPARPGPGWGGLPGGRLAGQHRRSDAAVQPAGRPHIRHLPEGSFHVYYLLFFGLYFQSMVGLFALLSGTAAGPLRWAFIVLLLLAHSALLRLLGSWWLGTDYLWFFQAGLAGQYVLGPTFQPSVFGVLLIVSIYLFLLDWPFVAVTCTVLAGVVHATYLPSAALLTLAYLVVLAGEGRGKTALGLGALAGLLVLPVVIRDLRTFGPSSPEEFARAQYLLAHFRVPHHTQLRCWLTLPAVAQVAWIIAALGLVRGTRLFAILAAGVRALAGPERGADRDRRRYAGPVLSLAHLGVPGADRHDHRADPTGRQYRAGPNRGCAAIPSPGS